MDNSLFNDLPAEIRNTIYGYALYEPEALNIKAEPALLATCKQIRIEALLMYWAVNGFQIGVHEETMNHDICEWLRRAGFKLQLIQSLKIHINMPSVGSITQEAGEQAQEACPDELFHLMHIVDSLRLVDWRRPHIENVVSFTLNGACDSETFENIDAMSPADQDRFRGAKFFLLCLVHGTVETARAMDAADGQKRLEERDEKIQERREDHARWNYLSLEAT